MGTAVAGFFEQRTLDPTEVSFSTAAAPPPGGVVRASESGPGAPCSSPRRLRRQLLIVQRNAAAARALARHFRRHYDRVSMECAPARVLERLLSGPACITDIVCGQRFDNDELGSAWIRRWRGALRSSLEVGAALDEGASPEDEGPDELRWGRIVLATAEPLARLPAGVDAVFRKPLDPAALLSFLCSFSRAAA